MSLLRRKLPEYGCSESAQGRTHAAGGRLVGGLVPLPLALGALLSACCLDNQGSKPVPLRKAVHNFEKDLNGLHVVVLSDAYRATSGCTMGTKEPDCWTEEGRAILDSIKFAQCFDLDETLKNDQNPEGMPNPELRTRNPLIPVATGPLQLTVSGQFTESGTFTIAAAPSAGGSFSRQTQQQVMLPLTLVSLSSLAEFYVGQHLSNLQYTTLVALYPSKDPPAGTQPEKDRQLLELKQTEQMVAFVMDVTTELTKIADFAAKNFNKLPATEASGKAHYCYKFEEGKDITASALR